MDQQIIELTGYRKERVKATISFEDNILMYNQMKGVFSFGK